MTVHNLHTGDPAVPMLPVEPGYKNIIRLQIAMFWVPIAFGAVMVDQLVLRDSPVFGGLSIAAPLIAIIALVTIPARIHARLGYRVFDRLLQSVRGFLFHTDTLVPFVRVQHIDVTRGPFDKMFGTASLIVHTAGTHNSIVTVNGLAPETAEHIRDMMRAHIRSDLD